MTHVIVENYRVCVKYLQVILCSEIGLGTNQNKHGVLLKFSNKTYTGSIVKAVQNNRCFILDTNPPKVLSCLVSG